MCMCVFVCLFMCVWVCVLTLLWCVYGGMEVSNNAPYHWWGMKAQQHIADHRLASNIASGVSL